MNNKSMRTLTLSLLVSGLMSAGYVHAGDANKMGDHSDKWSKAQFTKFDTNNDGRISTAEHVAGARASFDEIDVDRDGRITAAEMDAHKLSQTDRDPRDTHTSAAKIQKLDTNNDGVVSADEYAAGKSQMFTSMDADGDGFISSTDHRSGYDASVAGRNLDGSTNATGTADTRPLNPNTGVTSTTGTTTGTTSTTTGTTTTDQSGLDQYTQEEEDDSGE